MDRGQSDQYQRLMMNEVITYTENVYVYKCDVGGEVRYLIEADGHGRE